ncbi:hypothetical protein RJ639_045834 [Escallonia herrerae]|uniref:Transposase MuDR plant domain-containing protein n=1 Tax=Escallonia herrerae TaxID=1293975 RepID=A0AA88WCT0_9ASTE|nr:hypothetical protein RJ639_045834 [Escallonia herrerae]
MLAMFSLFRGVGDVVMVYVEHAVSSEGRVDGGTNEVVDNESDGDGNNDENNRQGLGENVDATTEDGGDSGSDSDSEASSAVDFEYFAEGDALCDKLIDADVNMAGDINEDLNDEDSSDGINENEDKTVNEDDSDGESIHTDDFKEVDSDGESLHSPNNSGDDELTEKYPKFDRSRNVNNVELKLGMLFANAVEFRAAVREHSIKQGYQYKYKKNESHRVTVVCKFDCGWRIHASYMHRGSSTYQIKSLKGRVVKGEVKHRCLRKHRNKHSQKVGFLGSFRPFIGFDACHLKGAYGGQLMHLMGRDANGQMYPLAIVVVEQETKDNWCWEAYIRSYKPVIIHVPDKSQWEMTPFDDILSPAVLRAPGRPKKLRRKALNEPRSQPRKTQQNAWINPGGNERGRGAGRGKGAGRGRGRGTRRGRGAGRGSSVGVDIGSVVDSGVSVGIVVGASGPGIKGGVGARRGRGAGRGSSVGVDSGAVVDSGEAVDIGVGASGLGIDGGVGASGPSIHRRARTSTGTELTLSPSIASNRSLIAAQHVRGTFVGNIATGSGRGKGSLTARGRGIARGRGTIAIESFNASTSTARRRGAGVKSVGAATSTTRGRGSNARGMGAAATSIARGRGSTAPTHVMNRRSTRFGYVHFTSQGSTNKLA